MSLQSFENTYIHTYFTFEKQCHKISFFFFKLSFPDIKSFENFREFAICPLTGLCVGLRQPSEHIVKSYQVIIDLDTLLFYFLHTH